MSGPESLMEKGVKTWLVDISQWNPPSSQHFSFALSLLPPHERSSISRYAKVADRKRALVSRLLQYALVHQLTGIPFHEITIKRTAEGKPYLDYDCTASNFPNFNFNVSHHGDLVAIASEPLCLVGVDIVCPTHPLQETVPSFLHKFSSFFSSSEWHRITNADTCDQMLDQFYRFWSLKEAFVKALGGGMGSGLDTVEFHHNNWTDISIRVDGEELKEWTSWHFEPKKGHYVTVARGCPRMACGSHKKTLKCSNFGVDEYESALHLPNMSYQWQTIEQLISICTSRSINCLPETSRADKDTT